MSRSRSLNGEKSFVVIVPPLCRIIVICAVGVRHCERQRHDLPERNPEYHERFVIETRVTCRYQNME
jgi:hypothetical protein